jgi:hypothetical protein
MNRFLLSLLLMIFITRCTPEVPADVLPPAKMQAVFWDLMRADEMSLHNTFFDSSWTSTEKNETVYQEIFAIHGISRERFKTSLTYYQSHPKLLKTIMDSIQAAGDRLQRMEDSSRLHKNADSSNPLRKADTVRHRKLPFDTAR